MKYLCLLGTLLLTWIEGGVLVELVDRESFLSKEVAERASGEKREDVVVTDDTFPCDIVDSTSFLSSMQTEDIWIEKDYHSATASFGPKNEVVNKDEVFDLAIDALNIHDYDRAIQLLQELITKFPSDSNLHFNLGVSYQQAGDLVRALQSYETSFNIQSNETRALLNFAVIVQGMGDFDLASSLYRKILNYITRFDTYEEVTMYCKVASNLGSAYFQASRTAEAAEVFKNFSQLLRGLIDLNCVHKDSKPGNSLIHNLCIEMQLSYDQAMNYLLLISHSLAHFERREVTVSYLVCRTLLNTDAKHSNQNRCFREGDTYFAEGDTGPMLPFDTLSNEMSLADRLTIARDYSNHLFAGLPSYSRYLCHSSPMFVRSNRKLRLGFITCDFNDHPTAHLVEGIFDVVKREQVSKGGVVISNIDPFSTELISFSYGASVESVYRDNIKLLSDKFIDLSNLSNSEASNKIQHEDIDILLDMQIHTLGHRLQITAAQPARIQMNYLVYPASSGASFLQYIVCDRVVTPSEHALHYSESYLMLPSTYQISFYDRYIRYIQERPQLLQKIIHKKIQSQPPLNRVLSNFNKIDKLDFESLMVWSQIMSRYPTSSFDFVIDTRIEAVENIRKEFAFRGVPSSRVNFLPRVGKEEHISRHVSVDLFLDSFVYGAHSTATDALMGGAPVLTVEGETFPQRVASSLLQSLSFPSKRADGLNGTSADPKYEWPLKMLSTALQAFSKKEFEDLAIKLLRDPFLLLKLRRLLLQASGIVQQRNDQRKRRGFFDTALMVQHFLRGMHATVEADNLRPKAADNLPHIIVTDN